MWNPAKDWVGWLLIVSLVGGSVWGYLHPHGLRQAGVSDADFPFYWKAIHSYANRLRIDDGPEAFLRRFKKLPPAVGHLWAASLCHTEVVNGGFEEFFSNPTGMLAPEAVEGFRAIGLSDAADVVQQAMDVFPQPYPRDRAERSEFLDEKLQSSNLFGKLDKVFIELMASENGDLDVFKTAANRYARENLK